MVLVEDRPTLLSPQRGPQRRRYVAVTLSTIIAILIISAVSTYSTIDHFVIRMSPTTVTTTTTSTSTSSTTTSSTSTTTIPSTTTTTFPET